MSFATANENFKTIKQNNMSFMTANENFKTIKQSQFLDFGKQ